ncbi:MAG: hypothetical protein JXA21_22435 [Anaerolineae bacterium]|nr:hypothetical protein [Anaerolineae bacterium]
MIISLLQHIRRNHSLEHATINLVTEQYPLAQVVGFSGPWGFTLYTSLTAEEIVPAVMKALQRLKAGESNLRIHANCGTNLAVAAMLTAGATLLGTGKETSWLKRLERFPQLILLNVLALMVARPLGEWVQAHLTTDPDLTQMDIASIFTDLQGHLRRIRVHTRQAA